MADKKISALTAATTPLAGTEVLPIVQSGATVKVEVNDMLETISVTSPAVNSEGNIFLRATDTLGTGVGTQIGLGGKYNASSYFPFAAVAGRKENATNNNVAGYLSLLTTTSGGTLTERMRISSAGDATVNTGNLVIGTAGKGIDFSANTHAAGMTSELLNWYEEGAFTPTMTSAAGTVTVNVSNGRYTRIGNRVFVAMKIDYTTNLTVATSNITFGALPFTSGSTYYFKGFIVESNWTTSDINDGNLVGNLSATTITWANRLVSQSSRTNAVIWVVAEYFAA